MGVVFMGVITTCVVSFVFDMPMSTMVGILSGAVTNTPGLGAASQTYFDIFGKDDPTISLGYAVAYPLGVIGVISSMIIIKAVFRISFEREMKEIEPQRRKRGRDEVSIVMANPSLFGKKIDDVVRLAAKRFVISLRLRPRRTHRSCVRRNRPARGRQNPRGLRPQRRRLPRRVPRRENRHGVAEARFGA